MADAVNQSVADQMLGAVQQGEALFTKIRTDLTLFEGAKRQVNQSVDSLFSSYKALEAISAQLKELADRRPYLEQPPELANFSHSLSALLVEIEKTLTMKP